MKKYNFKKKFEARFFIGKSNETGKMGKMA
jgi:hypothetical protein